MKFKSWLLIILILSCCIFSYNMCVNAQEFSYQTEGASFELSTDGTKIKISGSLNSKLSEKYVSLLVLNPGTSLDSWGNDDVVQNQLECLTDENGEFTFTFTINTTIPDVVSTYPAYIKVQGMNKPLSFDIPLITQTARDNAVVLLNGSDSLTASLNLSSATDALAFEFADVLKTIDTSILENKLISEIPFSDDLSAGKWLKEEIVLEAFRQSKTEFMTDDKGLFSFAEEVGISDMDEINNLSVYKVYTAELNSNGLAAVINFLSGKTYQNAESLQKEFAKAVVIEGIRNYFVDGSAHINSLLTLNGSYVGLDLSEYIGETLSKDTDLLIGKYDSISEIQAVLDKNYDNDDDGRASSGKTGGGGGKNFAVTPSVVQQNNGVTPEIEQEPVYFITDVDMQHWAKDAINAMLKANIISKPEDMRFRPDDAITREEFVKLLVLTFNIPTNEQNEAIFSDVAASRWSAPYVYAAYNAGIVKGISEESFGVENKLSRQDMATMIYRAFLFNGLAVNNNVTIEFADHEEISDYAKESVYSLCTLGAINGMGDGSFAPLQLCTRAQSAKVLYTFLKR